MLLTNHALTGAYLGLSIDNPALLLPTVIASHFALDSLPHFGAPGHDLKHGAGFVLGCLDFASATAVTIGVCLTYPERIPHILTGVLGAVLPDLFYIPDILFGVRLDGPYIKRFHGWIQWGERDWGTWIEAAWAMGMIYLILIK
jgi:hypothetical protein